MSLADLDRVPNVFDLSTWERPFVNAKQLAGYVDVEPRSIIRMIEVGSLKGTKTGRAWRIPTDAAREAFHVQRTAAPKPS